MSVESVESLLASKVKNPDEKKGATDITVQR